MVKTPLTASNTTLSSYSPASYNHHLLYKHLFCCIKPSLFIDGKNFSDLKITFEVICAVCRAYFSII